MFDTLVTLLLCLIVLLILCNLCVTRKVNTKKGRIRFIYKSKNIFFLTKGYAKLGHTYVGCFVHTPNYYRKVDFLYFATNEKNYIKLKEAFEEGNMVSLSYKKKFIGDNVFVCDVVL